MIDEKARDAVAQAIYEALGYEYAGKLIDIKGQPMGAWRDALNAADAAILAYEAAKPKEAEGLKLGSRLTVEGVEAVVVPVEPSEFMLDSGACYHDPRNFYREEIRLELFDEGESVRDIYRAMLSAAGDRE